MAELDQILADARTSNYVRDDKGRFSSVTPTDTPQDEPAVTAPVQAPEPQVQATHVEAPAQADTPPPAASVPAVSDQPQMVPLKAVLEEREKRQKIEREFQEFQQKQAAPPPDFWADPEARLKYEQFVERCNWSEELARTKWPDYDEVRTDFLEEAKQNPVLNAMLNSNPNPAAYAYREGLRIRKLKEYGGDFTAYEKATEERIRKELSAAVKPLSTTPAVPASLNSEGSPAVMEGYSGPKPLEEILSKRS